MKKLIIILTGLTILSLGVFGQTVTIKDLIDRTNCDDYSCFNNFITTKGFSYFESEDSETGRTYFYTSNKKFPASSTPEISTPNIAILTLSDTGSPICGFRTSVVEHYNVMIAQLKSMGFISMFVLDIEDGVSETYKFPSYPKLSVRIETNRIGDGKQWTSYYIGIYKLL